MTYAGARRMHEAARDGGTLLSINHQRRWDPVYRGARDAIRAGEIGEVESLEGYCANLFDWGSHLVDLILFFCEDECPAQVFGQIDVAERRHVYGALIETASVTYLHWADGRNAAVFTGRPNHLTRVGHTLLTVQGTDGRLEVTSAGATVRRFDGGCRVISPVLDPEHDVALGGVEPAIIQATALALEDLVQCLETGRQPLLSSAHGLNAAEIIFATYESSATRRPVDLPLGPVDNPLHRGLELGYWSPVGESYGTS
jgi:UDP-N-acetylglucosamine 3-dehydrogenase